MSPMQARRRYASLLAAAEYAGGCSERTLRRMISAGQLTGYRLGRHIRVDLNELDEALTPTREGRVT